jgi:hypothetical protein
LNVKRFDKLSILLTVLLLQSGQALSETWQHSGTVRVSTEYDSNPAMALSAPGGVWRYLFEPGYTLARIVGENEFKAGINYLIARSSNEILSPKRNSPSVFLNWLRHSDAGEFGISSRYAEIATRDAGIDAADQVPVDSIRASRAISGKWSKALSERSTLSVDGSYENVSYTGGTFVDYITRSENMSFSYDLSERNTPFLKLSHIDYEPTDDPSLSSYSNTLFVGWNRKFSDNVDGMLQAGRTKFSDEKLVTQGAATLRYAGQRTGLGLSAERLVSPSGLGGFITVKQMSASWSYALSERSKTGIDLGWRETQLETDNINRTASMWLQRDLNSFWELRTYYLRRNFEQVGAYVASSNLLGLSLLYTHNDF